MPSLGSLVFWKGALLAGKGLTGPQHELLPIALPAQHSLHVPDAVPGTWQGPYQPQVLKIREQRLGRLGPARGHAADGESGLPIPGLSPGCWLHTHSGQDPLESPFLPQEAKIQRDL